MGIAILSGVFTSLQTRPADPQTPMEPVSGFSTPTQSFSLSAPEASLPSGFIATVGREETVRKLSKTLNAMDYVQSGRAGKEGIKVLAGPESNLEAVRKSDVILLCCKPQMVAGILTQEGMDKALEGKMVISICAGVRLEQLKDLCPASSLCLRAMPNTPSKIGEGMTVITPPPTSSPPISRQILLSLFTPCGRVRFLDEKHFDACTALAGSGPAFVALVLEAMADGGVMMGLPRAEALELAAQTLQGTGRMALQTGLHPAQLKDSVTTPGGCTIAGLLTLEDGKVRSTMARAIQVATLHAAGLGQSKN